MPSFCFIKKFLRTLLQPVKIWTCKVGYAAIGCQTPSCFSLASAFQPSWHFCANTLMASILSESQFLLSCDVWVLPACLHELVGVPQADSLLPFCPNCKYFISEWWSLHLCLHFAKYAFMPPSMCFKYAFPFFSFVGRMSLLFTSNSTPLPSWCSAIA